MKQPTFRNGAFLALGIGTLLSGACAGDGKNPGAPFLTSTEAVGTGFGTALTGLTARNSSTFDEGIVAFTSAEDAEDGLGPVFNDISCVGCHAAGGPGGAGTDLNKHRVTRIGGLINGQYSDLEAYGGPVLQSRSLREFDPSVPFGGEVVPPQATFVSRRLTTPLFGLGLIEAIDGADIQSRSGVNKGLGIVGVANIVTNPRTGAREVGRFGWKAQVSDLEVFAADAYLNEMGITSPLFTKENLPQGHAFPDGFNTGAQPNDTEDVELLTAFTRFAAPPPMDLSLLASKGAQAFEAVGCGKCHVAAMKTGRNAEPALSNKTVRLYSDLLLHHMGSMLADGIQQGQATGDQFRTAPLWGISVRPFLLHDGRAKNVREAIAYHDGEARQVRETFMRLNPKTQEDLLNFVTKL